MSRIPLTVTADDYGLTDATCRAIVEAHACGVVTATSVLAVVPGIEHRMHWAAEAEALSVGVHLAVVGEDRPLLAAAEIPTLVDRHGRFHGSWRHLVPRLATGRVDPDDLRREFGAQIELVGRHLHPTHLDTHQHVHLWPTVADVVVELAVAHEIGAVRVTRPTLPSLRNRAIGRLSDGLARRVAAAGLDATERYRGLDEAGGWSTATLLAALRDLAGGSGSVEINLHLGEADDPERSRFPWGYAWADELAAARAPEVRDAVDRLGFELVGR